MTIQSLDYASMATLADLAARRLAKTAITNLELREALQTTKSANGVKIGDCEITYRDNGSERIYQVVHSNREPITGIVFYETARYLVTRLNAGAIIASPDVKDVLLLNDEYRRARETARFHADRMQHYSDRGNGFKADLNEDRFGRALARAQVLRQRLLEVHPSYF